MSLNTVSARPCRRVIPSVVKSTLPGYERETQLVRGVTEVCLTLAAPTFTERD